MQACPFEHLENCKYGKVMNILGTGATHVAKISTIVGNRAIISYLNENIEINVVKICEIRYRCLHEVSSWPFKA